MNEEVQAKRMHPLWIPLLFIRSVKELVLFSVFLFAVKALKSDSSFLNIWIIISILFLIYKSISAFFSWKHFKYIFTENKILIFEGRLKKKQRFISLDRIQGIKRSTTLIHRVFNLTSLQLNTGSTGKEGFVKLEMITFDEAERIEKLLRESGYNKSDSLEGTNSREKSMAARISNKYVYSVKTQEIIIGSLTSNSVIIFIAVLHTLYFNLKDFLLIEKYIGNTLSFFQRSWLTILFGIFIFLILSMAYTLFNNYIKYRNFRVSSNQHRIFIEKGLIETNLFSIPKEKVQAIDINTSLLQKFFLIVQVKIISVGKEEGEGEGIGVFNILFPFIKKDRALHLVPSILPEFKINQQMCNLPRSAIIVKTIRGICFGLFIVLIVLKFFPEFWYISVILFLLSVISQVLNGLHSAYNLNGVYMQLQKGAFTTKLFVTTRSKIEEFKVTESFLQRKFGLASIYVYTRADPILKTKMSDIPKEMAIRYYQWYANKNEV
ncbi:PH domain-containing protein [Caldalkalibacillus mannanilyticus]|uniref:PH domain-containing protein n=1 Tax=Caldalkalibacillus mannanilyticus TaxID=1418 RepID=UPI0006848A82|nr:PH domain-containing protein [Caldalkalibacillus mannanilyticus]